MRLPLFLGVAIGLTALAGCQSPDVGQPCSLDIPGTSGAVTADYLETGKTECDSLVCLKSPAPASYKGSNPYCTKPCASDNDCYPDQTGLKCLDVLPDQKFLDSLSAEDRAKYLGSINLGKYCKIPS
jgi:hypothetical protein